MELTKVQIKVKLGRRGFTWVHFCYIPLEVKREFDEYVTPKNQLANYWITKWAVEDFGKVNLETEQDLANLKNLIRDRYKTEYPELYIESNTDNQGWLRVWYTKNMERELENCGR